MPLFCKGIFCFWLIFPAAVFGQNPVIADIQNALSERPVFDADINTRNSFIATKHAGIFGIRAGLDYDSKVKLGLSFSFLFTDIHNNITVTNSRGEREVVSARFHMRYSSPYAAYLFHDQNRLKLSLQILLGAGTSQFRYIDSYQVRDRTRNRFVLVYEPHMTGEYKLFKYFGVGAGLGYRLVYSPDAFSRTRLNSPIWVAKAVIYFGDLYKALRGR